MRFHPEPQPHFSIITIRDFHSDHFSGLYLSVLRWMGVKGLGHLFSRPMRLCRSAVYSGRQGGGVACCLAFASRCVLRTLVPSHLTPGGHTRWRHTAKKKPMTLMYCLCAISSLRSDEFFLKKWGHSFSSADVSPRRIRRGSAGGGRTGRRRSWGGGHHPFDPADCPRTRRGSAGGRGRGGVGVGHSFSPADSPPPAGGARRGKGAPFF